MEFILVSLYICYVLPFEVRILISNSFLVSIHHLSLSIRLDYVSLLLMNSEHSRDYKNLY